MIKIQAGYVNRKRITFSIYFNIRRCEKLFMTKDFGPSLENHKMGSLDYVTVDKYPFLTEKLIKGMSKIKKNTE